MRMYHVGCSGWYYQHWSGRFYRGVAKNKWFEHYARSFDTVELNSTFYHFPRESTARGWYRKAPEGFAYTLKANRVITHIKRFSGTKTLVRDFCRVADVLGEKLGCILFQLPPSVHYSREKLDGILSQLDPGKRNVLEFRHRSWWNEDVYRELREMGVIFCIVSAGGLPDDFVKTSRDTYVRFHGREWYSYSYSRSELMSFSDKIRKSGARNAWCYFNNDFNCYAVDNALQLRGFLER